MHHSDRSVHLEFVQRISRCHRTLFLAAYTACFLPVPVCTSTVVQNMPVGDYLGLFDTHFPKAGRIHSLVLLMCTQRKIPTSVSLITQYQSPLI